jgi:hypothetical protein
MGFLQEPKQPSKSRLGAIPNGHPGYVPRDFLSILASAVPRLQLILTDNERINAAALSISANVTGPTIRAKAFPSNVDEPFLELLYNLTKLSQGSKAWKKDVTEALNDARLFNTPAILVQSHWAPILYQLILNDKDRMPELLGRLTAPTTAGIVFGVGATSARMEADKRTQLNLKRIALLILSNSEDTFVPNLPTLSEKIIELLTATPTSSPSSATRADVYILLRSMILKISSMQLAPLWPIINKELQDAILSLLPETQDLEKEKWNALGVLQAAKLLDCLVTMEQDDFQLLEWLFVTDTIDAVYRPAGLRSVALADEVAEALGTTSSTVNDRVPSFSGSSAHSLAVDSGETLRRPVLDSLIKDLEEEGVDIKKLGKPELAGRILRPFFGQLGMLAFEATYRGGEADIDNLVLGVVGDLFDGDVSIT